MAKRANGPGLAGRMQGLRGEARLEAIVPKATSLASATLTAIAATTGALLLMTGLILLACWMLWCLCTVVAIAMAVASNLLGCDLRWSLEPALDPLLYTAIGEGGVLLILFSRRVESCARPPVEEEPDSADRARV